MVGRADNRPARSAADTPSPSGLLRVQRVFASILMLTVVGSAFAVIHSSHACRQLYAELQGLEADQWYLQEDYSRLLLEQSTWASHYRVEKVATSELSMQPPVIEEQKVVSP
ncbi:cell division protein FtsL [Parahaliea sp. F7430]|uniref:Cell division protein FtsL n=1 Tax=Sediminihaliea albiluteola TaxID=2758564 RepID=A0A7W2TW16_9GAMM|nr:cell division protein FtsL [Sediminihaliea albiluteola]MBA6412967.1 cell division protein FtsL [Sediminihaliea albiluteola]